MYLSCISVPPSRSCNASKLACPSGTSIPVKRAKCARVNIRWPNAFCQSAVPFSASAAALSMRIASLRSFHHATNLMKPPSPEAPAAIAPATASKRDDTSGVPDTSLTCPLPDGHTIVATDRRHDLAKLEVPLVWRCWCEPQTFAWATFTRFTAAFRRCSAMLELS